MKTIIHHLYRRHYLFVNTFLFYYYTTHISIVPAFPKQLLKTVGTAINNYYYSEIRTIDCFQLSPIVHPGREKQSRIMIIIYVFLFWNYSLNRNNLSKHAAKRT